MSQVKRIRFEFHPYSYVRSYHLTAQVSNEEVIGDSMVGSNRRTPFVSPYGAGELTEGTKASLSTFYKIAGIDSVGLEANTVRIQLSHAYEWPEVEDAIIATLKDIVGWTDDEDVTMDYLFEEQVYSEPIPEIICDIALARNRRIAAESVVPILI